MLNVSETSTIALKIASAAKKSRNASENKRIEIVEQDAIRFSSLLQAEA